MLESVFQVQSNQNCDSGKRTIQTIDFQNSECQTRRISTETHVKRESATPGIATIVEYSNVFKAGENTLNVELAFLVLA